MRFDLYTLVDITETRARRGDDPKKVRQQQNFHTVLQTIGLRVNPTYIKAPQILDSIPKDINFGKKYKKITKLWRYSFDIEYEGALSIDILNEDFHLIPIITGLDENISFDIQAFDTKNPDDINLVFTTDDK